MVIKVVLTVSVVSVVLLSVVSKHRRFEVTHLRPYESGVCLHAGSMTQLKVVSTYCGS